jgi:hypothetical protein
MTGVVVNRLQCVVCSVQRIEMAVRLIDELFIKETDDKEEWDL